MVIALLAVLGVDLVVIVVLVGLVLARRRWVSRRPGDFTGAIRLVAGDVPGLGPKWKRGHGRWVREVLVWTKAPTLFRSELVAVNDLAGEVRVAEGGVVKHLGNEPVIVPMVADTGARLEIAASEVDRARALGPWAPSSGAPVAEGQPD